MPGWCGGSKVCLPMKPVCTNHGSTHVMNGAQEAPTERRVVKLRPHDLVLSNGRRDQSYLTSASIKSRACEIIDHIPSSYIWASLVKPHDLDGERNGTRQKPVAEPAAFPYNYGTMFEWEF